jgi:hypothetical protein
MRLKRDEFLLMWLGGKMPQGIVGYRSPEQAYKELKHLTGQDFGYDIDAWREWFENADDRFPNRNNPMDDET